MTRVVFLSAKFYLFSAAGVGLNVVLQPGCHVAVGVASWQKYKYTGILDWHGVRSEPSVLISRAIGDGLFRAYHETEAKTTKAANHNET
jgi:hypothetical protein